MSENPGVDRDGYRVRGPEEFTSPAVFQHYIHAYQIIDSRGTGRRRADNLRLQRGRPTFEVGEAFELGLSVYRCPSKAAQRSLAEMRQHITTCIEGLVNDERRLSRFKWLKRNLYKAMRYHRGSVREEVLLDLVDDFLIKILEDANLFIPSARELSTLIRQRGEDYGA